MPPFPPLAERCALGTAAIRASRKTKAEVPPAFLISCTRRTCWCDRMQRQRRSFTEEYKRQAVELVSRRSVTSVAKKLGLRDSVLRRWSDKLRQVPPSAAWRRTAQATQHARWRAQEPLRIPVDVARDSEMISPTIPI